MNVNTHNVNILTKRKAGKGALLNDAPVCHPVFTSPFNVFHGERGNILIWGRTGAGKTCFISATADMSQLMSRVPEGNAATLARTVLNNVSCKIKLKLSGDK